LRYLVKPLHCQILPVKSENQETVYDYKDSQRGFLTTCSLKTKENTEYKVKKTISLKSQTLDNDTQSHAIDTKNDQIFTYTEINSVKAIQNFPLIKDIGRKNVPETHQ